jgi:hypothetical protein
VLQDAAPPEGPLLEQMQKDFGGLDKMTSTMNPNLAAIQACCLPDQMSMQKVCTHVRTQAKLNNWAALLELGSPQLC